MARSYHHRRRAGYRLTPPKVSVFLLCLVLIGLGIASHFVYIPVVTACQFWFLAVGGVLLLLSCLLRGL